MKTCENCMYLAKGSRITSKEYCYLHGLVMKNKGCKYRKYTEITEECV